MLALDEKRVHRLGGRLHERIARVGPAVMRGEFAQPLLDLPAGEGERFGAFGDDLAFERAQRQAGLGGEALRQAKRHSG